MKIFFKPNGRGTSHFQSSFGTKRLEVKTVNDSTEDSVCKNTFFNAVYNKEIIYTKIKKAKIVLEVEQIERSNKKGEIKFFGRVQYIYGFGFEWVNISGKARF